MRIFKLLYYAYANTNNIYIALFGDNVTNNNFNKEHKNSEFHKDNWSWFKYIKFISDICFIKLPISAPSWFPKYLKILIFGENSRYIPCIKEIDEESNCFIYVNGIMSNLSVVKTNQEYLETLLNRQINIIHNVTDSLVMDLIESLIGKETEDLTEASTIALYTISKKLLDPDIKKIIIICYSQGTIIISKVIQSLEKLGLDKIEYLKKLEIYAFACCASKMMYIKDELPYIEHFANENDIIAKLGCNVPNNIKHMINLDGNIFIAKNDAGHMLNAHYLYNFKDKFPNSKFNKYINT